MIPAVIFFLAIRVPTGAFPSGTCFKIIYIYTEMSAALGQGNISDARVSRFESIIRRLNHGTINAALRA